MTAPKRSSHGELFKQLSWFIRLRWIAALAVIIGTVLDATWLHWYESATLIGVVGTIICIYNLAIWVVLQRVERSPARRRFELWVAWAQLLLDLASLTLLSVWTGGLMSPVATFFVFHMVFASLLLQRKMSYAAPAAAVVIFLAGLWIAREAPATRTDWLLLLGRAITLILTVYLINHLTVAMRHQRRRLVRQNKRIKHISRQLSLHQQALIQHEKMVAMGQMAAGVTHEIANPLASMDSLLQLMQRKPEKLRPDAITTLREQIARISQIIHQMKAFAHPVEMTRQVLPLNDVVTQALEMVRFDKRLKRVTIDRNLSPDVGEIPILPQAIQQVVVNLVSNALDAVENVPEPKLIVRTERRQESCVIEVTDNGTGIKLEHMARLFEPFFTTKPVGQGTGLGLSISYSLIQKNGGQISARSQVGKGTTFTIRLPFGQSASRVREELAAAAISTENPSR
jgi:signal transduction histidine kinase